MGCQDQKEVYPNPMVKNQQANFCRTYERAPKKPSSGCEVTRPHIGSYGDIQKYNGTRTTTKKKTELQRATSEVPVHSTTKQASTTAMQFQPPPPQPLKYLSAWIIWTLSFVEWHLCGVFSSGPADACAFCDHFRLDNMLDAEFQIHRIQHQKQPLGQHPGFARKALQMTNALLLGGQGFPGITGSSQLRNPEDPTGNPSNRPARQRDHPVRCGSIRLVASIPALLSPLGPTHSRILTNMESLKG